MVSGFIIIARRNLNIPHAKVECRLYHFAARRSSRSILALARFQIHYSSFSIRSLSAADRSDARSTCAGALNENRMILEL
jgi:hypothetical protein